MDKLWFVVMRRAGREAPSLYHDHLPAWITGKHSNDYGVVHVELLGENRAELSLQALWADYQRQKAYENANRRHPLPLSGTREV